ncbi:MAG TPA: DUF1302 family protein [Atribacteraceae bacterium]|nr:DUF1302 family protein [Atribacteraceae bacterium]
MAISILILILCLITPVFPVLASPITGEASLSTSWDLAGGRLTYGLELDLNYETPIFDHYYLSTALTLQHEEGGYDPDFFRWREAYLKGFGVPWEETDFRLGWIQVVWGASDLMSPVDVINPAPLARGIGEGFLGEKIPVPAVNLEWYLNFVWSLELVYQPAFMANVVPEALQKQFMSAALVPQLGVGPDDLVYDFTYREPEVGFLDPIWGVRVRGKVGGVDLALSYYRGYYLNPTPYRTAITSSVTGNGLPFQVDVDFGYPQRQMLGLEFQGELEALPGATFRGDVALFFPERWTHQISLPQPDGTMIVQEQIVLEQPYWKASLGVDYTTEDNVYLNLGYILGTPQETGDDVSSYLFLRAERPSDDGKWKPFVNSVLSLADGSMVNALGVSYTPQPDWDISLTYSFASGPPGGKLAGIGDGIFLSAQYAF